MFQAMDTDNSGAITFDELKAGLRRYGSTLKDTEIRDLMDAVRCLCQSIDLHVNILLHHCNLPSLYYFFKVASPFLHFLYLLLPYLYVCAFFLSC